MNHKIYRRYLKKIVDLILHTGYYWYVIKIIFFLHLYGDTWWWPLWQKHVVYTNNRETDKCTVTDRYTLTSAVITRWDIMTLCCKCNILQIIWQKLELLTFWLLDFPHMFIQTFKVTHWKNYHILWETDHNHAAPVCAGSLLTAWHMIVVGSQGRQMDRVNMPVAVASLFVQTFIYFLTAVHSIYYLFLHTLWNTLHYLTYLTV
jgi:hypothetical protein